MFERSTAALRLFCILLVLMCMTPDFAVSQPAPYAIQRGLSLGLDVAQTSAWDVERSPPNTPVGTISDATGLALTVSYGLTSWLAPWISYAASLYGEYDPSAVDELTAGFELRGQWFRRFVPSVGFGLGRTSLASFSFTHADLAGGAEFFASRRIAFRAGLHVLIPVGEPSGSRNTGDTLFEVSDERTQLRLGVRVHLGSGE